MLKGIVIKILIIILIFIFLTGLLLAYSKDCLSIIFGSNDLWQYFEILKLIVLSILGFILLLFVKYLAGLIKIYKNDVYNKRVITFIILVIVFGFKGYEYTLGNNIFLSKNYKANNNICSKMNEDTELTIKSETLTIEEYNIVRSYSWFPSISKDAYDIEFIYRSEDLIPDYYFKLIYKVPNKVQLKKIENFISNSVYEKQDVIILEQYKKIVYEKINQ